MTNNSLNLSDEPAGSRSSITKEQILSSMPISLTRRSFTAIGAGFAAGLFANRIPGAFAQASTPVALTPAGYVSVRIRQLVSADARNQVNELVMTDFAPKVQKLDGYGGYVLGDVIDNPAQSVSVVALDRQDQAAGFDDIAKNFVNALADKVDAAATKQWAGDLLMWGAPQAATATPIASPVAGAGYIALRVHTSLAGTDPRGFVPAAIAGFLPIVTRLPGFKAYLWFPIDTGFVAVSIYDSIDSAQASNVAAKDWATQNLKLYTDGNPMIVNANAVFEDLPILARLKPLV